MSIMPPNFVEWVDRLWDNPLAEIHIELNREAGMDYSKYKLIYKTLMGMHKQEYCGLTITNSVIDVHPDSVRTIKTNNKKPKTDKVDVLQTRKFKNTDMELVLLRKIKAPKVSSVLFTYNRTVNEFTFYISKGHMFTINMIHNSGDVRGDTYLINIEFHRLVDKATTVESLRQGLKLAYSIHRLLKETKKVQKQKVSQIQVFPEHQGLSDRKHRTLTSQKWKLAPRPDRRQIHKKVSNQDYEIQEPQIISKNISISPFRSEYSPPVHIRYDNIPLEKILSKHAETKIRDRVDGNNILFLQNHVIFPRLDGVLGTLVVDQNTVRVFAGGKIIILKYDPSVSPCILSGEWISNTGVFYASDFLSSNGTSFEASLLDVPTRRIEVDRIVNELRQTGVSDVEKLVIFTRPNMQERVHDALLFVKDLNHKDLIFRDYTLPFKNKYIYNWTDSSIYISSDQLVGMSSYALNISDVNDTENFTKLTAFFDAYYESGLIVIDKFVKNLKHYMPDYYTIIKSKLKKSETMPLSIFGKAIWTMYKSR